MAEHRYFIGGEQVARARTQKNVIRSGIGTTDKTACFGA